MQQIVGSDLNGRRQFKLAANLQCPQPSSPQLRAPAAAGLDKSRIATSIPPYTGSKVNGNGRTPRFSAQSPPSAPSAPSATYPSLVAQSPLSSSKSNLAVSELSPPRVDHSASSEPSCVVGERGGSAQQAGNWTRGSNLSNAGSVSVPQNAPQVVREPSARSIREGSAQSASPLTKRDQPMSLSLQQLGVSDQEIVTRLRSAEASKALAVAKQALTSAQVAPQVLCRSPQSGPSSAAVAGKSNSDASNGAPAAVHSHFSALSFLAASQGSAELGVPSMPKQEKAAMAKLQNKVQESTGSRNHATLSEASTISGSPTSAVAVASSTENSCCNEQLSATFPLNAVYEIPQIAVATDGTTVLTVADNCCDDKKVSDSIAAVPASPGGNGQRLVSSDATLIETKAQPAGMQLQLQEMMKWNAELMSSLRAEQHERESLAAAVRGLGKRLDDGLTSMSEVAAARSETEGATDAVLSAMRHCIDELSIQCAWPRSSASDADPLQAPTLSDAVRQQQGQLRQLSDMQAMLQVQHEEQCKQASMVASWMKQQQDHLDEGMKAVTAAIADFPARQETMAASIYALQHRVAELAAGCTDSKEQERSNASAAAAQLAAMQEQLQQVHARQHQQDNDLKAVASAMRELGEAAASSSATVASAASTAEVAASANAGLQSLKSEVTTIANAVNILCERVNSMGAKEQQRDQQRDLQTEIGAIANVVSNLSERVDRLSGDNAPRITGVRIGDTPEALRQQLAALVGDVRRVHERRDTEGAQPAGDAPMSSSISVPLAVIPQSVLADRAPVLAMGLPKAVSRKAPSPRKWMTEPLSVSVGRLDTMQVAPSDGSGAADRILARSNAAGRP